ncbi:cation-translocating P-type ATPase [Chitinophaga filiformis]|uniref:Cation-transporting P-type ATPase n=1 Tax=Chitinophaga filiformis TaxID=104663 RepID=A0ABY4I9D8_CHIFI|nr:HAD-IC family P-type ATPase [Chitinophaga filiformis]UPK72724.1 cation-transporting P-type ATPase [Chitinophaga filiformis]
MTIKNVQLSAYRHPVGELVRILETDIQKGLTLSQVDLRKEMCGLNEIVNPNSFGIWITLWRQFKSPVVLLLVAAALISAWYREWTDALAILVVVLINTGIGFIMEWQAFRSMKALSALTVQQARVLRDNVMSLIDVKDIVPGDIIYVEAGDIVPADGRIVTAFSLQVDESTLTGESVPVEKYAGDIDAETVLAEQTNMLFKATAVKKGNASILCTATGMATAFGGIAGLLTRTEDVTAPLEKKLAVFGRQLLLFSLLLVAVVIVAGLVHKLPVSDVLRTAIALSVAAIPEGLPIVATLALAKGMLRMARKHIIVKQLAAVETLGLTTVICTDKTGTLTENQLELVQLEFPPAYQWQKSDTAIVRYGESYKRFFQVAVLCNTSTVRREENGKLNTAGDPLEIALQRFIMENGSDIEDAHRGYVKVSEQPFSSETRIMGMVHEGGRSLLVTAKGAMENLLPRCTYILENNLPRPVTADDRKRWLLRNNQLAGKGLKPLAFAYGETTATGKDFLHDLTFIGLAGFLDPPRKDVASAVSLCQQAGIRIVMLTGDHPSTAVYVAEKLRLSPHPAIITGQEMKPYETLDMAEKKRWAQTDIFARVSPAQKLELINLLQEDHEIVAMTGDGVNDAPALRSADIGIAMGIRGSQISREAADMVLQDDAFSSLVLAIREGRVIFNNIRRFIVYLLSCNLSELLVVGVTAVAGFQFRLFPLQILLINLVTDVLPALALGITNGNGNEMAQKPKALNAPIISKAKWRAIAIYAVILTLFTLLGAKIAEYWSANANNVLFLTLTFSQLLHVLNMANAADTFYDNHIVRSKYIWMALAISTAFMLLIMLVPALAAPFRLQSLHIADWAIVILCSFASLLSIRMVRKFGLKYFPTNNHL